MATSNTSEKIILGIDPGTTIMGFGLIKVKGKTMEFLQLNELQLQKIQRSLFEVKAHFRTHHRTY